MEDRNLIILLVGSGGRESALAWKLAQSNLVQDIFVLPGNGGTAQGLHKVQNVSHVNPDDFPALLAFAREKGVNLVVPGPEAPLVAGIGDFFRAGKGAGSFVSHGRADDSAAGIRCFGPTKAAARMEGSKTFSKDFMTRHTIPTAQYQNFSDYDKARKFLDEVSYKVVVKATGLAAGKGVILPSSKEEAQTALKDIMLAKEFGSAGDEVVIEECEEFYGCLWEFLLMRFMQFLKEMRYLYYRFLTAIPSDHCPVAVRNFGVHIPFLNRILRHVLGVFTL